MRILLVFLIFSIGLHPIIGQNIEDDLYKKSQKTKVQTFKPLSNRNVLNIRSSFSRDTLHQIPFTDQRIISISLVYTGFSEDKLFDQSALDKRRIKHLVDLNPEIASNQFIHWVLIEQTGCDNYLQCKNLFHGFTIEYAPYPTKEMTIIEIDSIENRLRNFDASLTQKPEDLYITFDEIPCEYPKFSYSDDYIAERILKYDDCDQNYKAKLFFTAQVSHLGRPTEVKVNGYQYNCEEDLAYLLKKFLKWERGLVIGNQQYGLEVKGAIQFPIKSGSVEFIKYNFPKDLLTKHRIIRSYPNCLAYQVDTSFQKVMSRIEKAAVFKTLERNSWQKKSFVVDATASMYPYTVDLLKWIKVNKSEDLLRYVFFNDGDDKVTKAKKLGTTGGLYSVFTNEFKEVKTTLFECMKNGGGGDVKENNIEALLSLNASPTDIVIMITDNLSFPRDIALLYRFSGQLKIILCGTSPGINTDYLDLGRNQNISLHTQSTDLTNLTDIQTGEIILIDKLKYQLTNTGFRQLY